VFGGIVAALAAGFLCFLLFSRSSPHASHTGIGYVSEAVEENRGPIADASFQCQAQIVQDNSGYVEEILPRCNGSSVWQQSLVTAIRQASPLPAPPAASVFSRSITLSFVGLAYIQGAAEDEYESASRNTAASEWRN
jgi:hypothetical protein